MSDALDTRKDARDSLLARITEALKADDRFVAAWLTGSLGRQDSDALSDIDISVVIDTDYVNSLCDRPWMVAGRTTDERLKLFQQFGEPVIIHENNYNAPDQGTFTSVTYRADALTVDWTLLPQDNAIRSAMTLLLFSKREIPIQQKGSIEAEEERAKIASEKVAFFWMMTLVASKYMLRHDIVFFHTLLDGLYRTFMEVRELVEGNSRLPYWRPKVKLAATIRDQAQAIRDIAAQMLSLMPKVVRLGGNVPDDPMTVLELMLNLDPPDEAGPDNALTSIAESRREQVQRLISALTNHIGKRIGMYIGSNQPEHLWIFLSGFHVAARILGVGWELSDQNGHYANVVRERGWVYSSGAPFMEMQKRGMDNDAIIQEMIAIEVETWKRAYNITD